MSQGNEVRPAKQSQSVLRWIQDLKRYAHPQSIYLLMLGFSAGLPYLLVSATLSAWLKEAGLNYSEIGYFAWVSMTFSIKFFWAPIIDSFRFPLLSRFLGHRRGWLLAAQLGIAIGLAWMSFLSPLDQMMKLTMVAIAVAFCSATQDICIDAYRIQAVSAQMQGVVTTAYIAGYRIALLAAGAGALLIADSFDWHLSYLVMAFLMSVGVVTVLVMREPQSKIKASAHKWEVLWFVANVAEPFIDMLKRYGRFIFLLLAVVLFYRVSDIAMGNMANPFYLALGYSKSQIAWVTKIFGLFMVLLGSVIGGLFVARLSLFQSMLICLVSVIITNLLFASLAVYGQSCIDAVEICKAPSQFWLGIVISADNLAAGASNVVFIAFLSQQVSKTYSATQYALLSSVMTLLGKFVSGYSGVVVEAVGFPIFFVYVSCWGVPSILLLLALRYWHPASFQTHDEGHDEKIESANRL